MLVLVTCKFDKYPIKNKGAVRFTVFSYTQEQVTPKRLVGSSHNSNWSKILRLSWLPGSVMKIQSIMKALSCPQHFLHYKSMEKMFMAQGQVAVKREV